MIKTKEGLYIAVKNKTHIWKLHQAITIYNYRWKKKNTQKTLEMHERKWQSLALSN